MILRFGWCTQLCAWVGYDIVLRLGWCFVCWNFLGNKVWAQMTGFTAWESSLHVGTAETTFVKINSSWGVGQGEGMRENKLGDEGVGWYLDGDKFENPQKKKAGKKHPIKSHQREREKEKKISNMQLWSFSVFCLKGLFLLGCLSGFRTDTIYCFTSRWCTSQLLHQSQRASLVPAFCSTAIVSRPRSP